MAKKTIETSEDKPEDKLGSYLVDCTELRDFVAVVKPNATVGKHYVQEGFEDVVKEILDRQSDWGEQAGITNADIALFQQTLQRRAMIKAKLPAARALVTMLERGLLLTEHKLNRQVSTMASAAEDRASSNEVPELLEAYAASRKYRSALAMKAAKTRLKNAEEAAEAAAAAKTATSAPASTPAATAPAAAGE